jgi:two-component system NarL family sensor kinase
MKYLFIFCVMIFLHVPGSFYAQQIPSDLQKKLSEAGNDSARARTLLDIGEAIESESPEKSFNYYQQALVIGKRINNKRLILSSMIDIGISYIESNEMDKALKTFQDAIPVSKQVGDTGKFAAVLINIGNVYRHKKDEVKGIEYYLQAAALLEACSDKKRLAVLYSNLCGLFTDQEQLDKSIEYGNRSYEIALQIKDEFTQVNALMNLSQAYNSMESYDKEYAALQKALPLIKKNGDIEQGAFLFHSLGAYYFNKKEYDSALINFLESYNYSRKIGNQYHLCTEASMVALVYHKLNRTSEALKYIKQAEGLAMDVGERADLKEIFLTRAEIEAKRGNYKMAYEYRNKSADISDSVFRVESSRQVADMEAKYETVKKEKAIIGLQKDKEVQAILLNQKTTSIKQKSTLNYLLASLLLVILIAGFAGFRNFRHRQQLSKQQDEIREQRIRELEKDRQLIAVDSMLKGQEEERRRLAKDLHDGLGGMLSGVKFSLMNMKTNLVVKHENVVMFERSLDMLDTSIQELRRVAHNMMPEALVKFGLDEALKDYTDNINNAKFIKVNYQSFGMDQRLDSNTEIIVYRVVQELLANVFKHAQATEVVLQLLREENRLSVTVEDNGKGFNAKDLEQNRGAGWANIRSRVDYLKGKLDLNSEEGKGTSVYIELQV